MSAADKLLADIDAAFRLISESPEIGFTIEGIKPGIRCKLVRKNYLIFYQLTGEDVLVLRVLHSARKFDDLL